ncbi:MAG: hypothetical protein IPJ65_17190 [Archangiaceae bacterium]|nr:hypothetical protein [Archangiaceae bacterium]
MNWVAMGRRLVVGPDALRNVWLTLLVALLPLEARAFDGSISTELSGGNRTFSASLIGDWGLVPDRLYLVATYGVVRQAPDPALDTDPSHLLGLGVDVIAGSHWLTSLSFNFSPKASDHQTVVLHERVLDRLIDRSVEVTHTRRSAQALLAAAWQSNGLGDLEGGFDAAASAAWYELGSVAVTPHAGTFSATTRLWVLKPGAGATLTFFGHTDLGVRGTYTWYSEDPTTAGGFDRSVPAELRDTPRFESINSLFAQTQANANFSAAPPWFDLRASLTHRFGEKVSGRLAFTFTRYVRGVGNAWAVSNKWTWRVAGWARLWAAVTAQYDQLTSTASFFSGYGTLGAELATE